MTQQARACFNLRLLKKVQMQGGALRAERGVAALRRSERQGGRGTHPKDGSPQMGLFQQPKGGAPVSTGARG